MVREGGPSTSFVEPASRAITECDAAPGSRYWIVELPAASVGGGAAAAALAAAEIIRK